MGAQFGDRCFGTQADANAYACASVYPKTVSNGAGGVNVLSCSVLDDSHLTVTTTDQGGTATTATLPMTYAVCDPNAEVVQLGEVFGLLLGACAVVSAVKLCVYRLVANQ